MHDLVVVLAHYNTNRKSPFHKTWGETIFRCLESIPEIPVLCIDWNSTDGSEIFAQKICDLLGYDFFRIEQVNRIEFNWVNYFKCVVEQVDRLDTKNILYIECDTFFRISQEQIQEYLSAMKIEDIGAIKMCRMVADGVRPHWAERQLSSDVWLLPRFDIPTRTKVYPKRTNYLISEYKISSSRIWNSINTQCMMFDKNALLAVSERFDWNADWMDKTGHKDFSILCDQTFRTVLVDRLFGFNYGEKLVVSKPRMAQVGLHILNKYWDSKVSDVCPESIFLDYTSDLRGKRVKAELRAHKFKMKKHYMLKWNSKRLGNRLKEIDNVRTG